MKLEMEQRIGGGRATIARAALRGLTFRFGCYQPVLLDGKVIAEGMRGTEARSDAVRKVAAGVDASTVLDLGCAEGYMVRRCAEDGHMAIGVDADARRLVIAQLSAALDGISGIGFIKTPVTVETVGRLPASDVTVCLSVLHHVMYEHGVDYARQLLAAIRERTNTAFVFEMGQSNETAFPWASGLPDMGSDPHGWIASFLNSAGFASVEILTEVASFNSSVRRAIMEARP